MKCALISQILTTTDHDKSVSAEKITAKTSAAWLRSELVEEQSVEVTAATCAICRIQWADTALLWVQTSHVEVSEELEVCAVRQALTRSHDGAQNVYRRPGEY